jgi:hypothetical protein
MSPMISKKRTNEEIFREVEEEVKRIRRTIRKETDRSTVLSSRELDDSEITVRNLISKWNK